VFVVDADGRLINNIQMANSIAEGLKKLSRNRARAGIWMSMKKIRTPKLDLNLGGLLLWSSGYRHGVALAASTKLQGDDPRRISSHMGLAQIQTLSHTSIDTYLSQLGAI
jgi:hypothetical protein